jgi:hypothetical protein
MLGNIVSASSSSNICRLKITQAGLQISTEPRSRSHRRFNERGNITTWRAAVPCRGVGHKGVEDEDYSLGFAIRVRDQQSEISDRRSEINHAMVLTKTQETHESPELLKSVFELLKKKELNLSCVF